MSTVPGVLGRISAVVGSGLAVYIQPILLIGIAAALLLAAVLVVVIALIAVLSKDGARRADAHAVLKLLLSTIRPATTRSSARRTTRTAH